MSSAVRGVAKLVQASTESSPALDRFFELFFSRADADEFDGYSEESLAALVLSAWQFVSGRTDGSPKIRVENPASLDCEHGEVTVVDILNDDMPFIVDSIIGEFQDRGLTIHLATHPVFQVTRSADGRIDHLVPTAQDADAQGTRESYMQIHVACIEDAAAREALKSRLATILDQVRIAVEDWRPMLERLNRAIAAYTASPPPVAVADLAESIQFLKWLLDDNFTFLGMRALAFVGGEEEGHLEPVPDSGLGILHDPEVFVLRRGKELVHMTPEIRQFFLEPAPLIITKANVRSVVHRRVHMDYIGVKIYGEKGEISGELRIVGLFTSTAYTRSTARIPFLRHKVDMVVARSGFPPSSHSGKALANIIETFPRDELFQIDIDTLYGTVMGILALELRPRTRVFARIDRFDRFASVLVYVPRDRFATPVRQQVGAFLSDIFKGRVAAYYPFFPEGPLVRMQFIIGRYEGETPTPPNALLEARIAEIVRTWDDKLAAALGAAEGGRGLIGKYGTAFPPGYQATFAPERALADIKLFESLAEDNPVAIDFYRDNGDKPGRAHVALYHLHGPIPLSRRVPILENLGFSVIDERSYRIETNAQGDHAVYSLHDMIVEVESGHDRDLARAAARLEQGFLSVWRGEAGNDSYNRLVLHAGFDWRETVAVRAYGSYLRQIGAPFGQAYLADTLLRHIDVTRALARLFRLRLDPDETTPEAEQQAAHDAIVAEIEAALEQIPSLDEDRIIRHFLNLVETTLRTNFYQRDADGQPPKAIAFKFDSARVDGAPSPRPFAEIFVFSPRVEGIHLRGGRIARGGLRWSDRPQDFRTEVLGLAKAQQVKNVVIVPTGSKGGFVPRQLPAGGTREAVQEEGIVCYKQFISTLLALTDNLVDGRPVPPERVVRRDGDDPYLVVAADKGTATFSDIANEISVGQGFWLADAFASGGSAGYDHKKMGITARGAWEAVKRHFREMDWDIQSTPFRVIGVGDMSGDVFGNGMLLSKQTQLVAAFDHRDIFIDPEPDPAASWEERKRLFELPRSTWQDYDADLISPGGGVFSRSAKSIALSNEMRALLGIEDEDVTPNALIRAILKSEADLLWFGGIGTYVAAEHEGADEIGDRANDAVRVLAADLRVKVVGEGANLALTQDARVAFARAGGRVNTDAIDNSAGVNSSDLEVNIKIALGAAMAAGGLSLEERNDFLASMTDEVAEKCLRNNYLQSLALSLGERNGLADLGFQGRLMRSLERSGLLDREVENLPDDAELEERRAAGRGLTRPELAVLLAYGKIDLYNALIESSVPEDPYFEGELFGYFPESLQQRFPDQIRSHQLRREIIATRVSNAVINRGGSTMFVRQQEETGHSADAIALAFTGVMAIFDLVALYREIDALDTKLPGAVQLELYQRLQHLIRHQTSWFLRHADFDEGLSVVIDRYSSCVAAIRAALHEVMTADQRARFEQERTALSDAGLAQDLAQSIAALAPLAEAPDMVLLSDETQTPIVEVAALHGRVADYFRIDALQARARTLHVTDYFDRLAINSSLGALATAQRGIVQEILDRGGGEAFDAWHEANAERAARTRRAIEEILDAGELTLARLMVAVGHLDDMGAG